MKSLWIFTSVFLEYLVATGSYAYPDLWVQAQWTEFKALYGKNYSSVEEELFRKKIFLENRYMIAKHNERYGRGLISYKLKMNQFGDLLQHEFEEMMGSCVQLSDEALERMNASTFLPSENMGASLPKSVDWRSTLVTPVKDQGLCGACWAFSAAAAIEGQHARKTGRLVELSAQDLLDCCGEAYENSGCGGGLMDNAFRCARDRGGIDTADSYPYAAMDGPCRFKNSTVGASVSGLMVVVPRDDEKILQVAVATVGPISAAVYSKLPAFRFYSKGVYKDYSCGLFEVDHAVLIVGYGVTDDGTSYWILKNSWSKNWGEGGYMRLAKDAYSQCGIASLASFPLV
ncbi:cathepsin L1-like [Dermacentor andersoni]|uniref:cathepsin L1-like n=1 Tax=Dermacentor andersoni TaxID=34620 RepID=UPI003B3B7E96